MATKVKDCRSVEDWEWKDCDLKGHQDCIMLVCPDCGTKDRDCEYGN